MILETLWFLVKNIRKSIWNFGANEMENKIIAMSMVTYSNLVKKERLELALFVNVQKQVLRDDNGILLPKCCDLLWEKIVLVMKKNFFEAEITRTIYSSSVRKKFGHRMLF